MNKTGLVIVAALAAAGCGGASTPSAAPGTAEGNGVEKVASEEGNGVEKVSPTDAPSAEGNGIEKVSSTEGNGVEK